MKQIFLFCLLAALLTSADLFPQKSSSPPLADISLQHKMDSALNALAAKKRQCH